MRALRAAVDRPIVFRGFGGDACAPRAGVVYHTDHCAHWHHPVLRNLPFLLGMIRQ